MLTTQWTFWGVARIALTILVLTPLGLVLSKNIEKYVEQNGWDTFLIRWAPAMPDITPLLDSPWFLFGFGAAAMLTVVLWVDYYVPDTGNSNIRPIIIPKHQRDFWWHMGSMGTQPLMQIVGDFYFTNPSGHGVFISKSKMVAYHLKWKMIPWRRTVEGHVVSPDKIPPSATMDVRADFYIMPPLKRIGEPLYGRVCFLDQHGERHWSPLLKWEHDSKLASML